MIGQNGIIIDLQYIYADKSISAELGSDGSSLTTVNCVRHELKHTKHVQRYINALLGLRYFYEVNPED